MKNTIIKQKLKEPSPLRRDLEANRNERTQRTFIFLLMYACTSYTHAYIIIANVLRVHIVDRTCYLCMNVCMYVCMFVTSRPSRGSRIVRLVAFQRK